MFEKGNVPFDIFLLKPETLENQSYYVIDRVKNCIAKANFQLVLNKYREFPPRNIFCDLFFRKINGYLLFALGNVHVEAEALFGKTP